MAAGVASFRLRRMRRSLRATAAAAVLASILGSGPVANAADPIAPPAMAPAARQVELIADEPGITYWIYDGGTGKDPAAVGTSGTKIGVSISSFRLLCVVPCAAPLAPGTYTLGVSRPNNRLVTVPAITLRGDEVLKATYKSRTGMRLGFFVGGLLTAAIGGAVAFSGDESGGRQALGISILAIGVLGMATPLFIQDKARIVPITP